MKVAVLSGKGGAGKTFVAVNLAAAAGKAVYADCDVEEPNGRLFLEPTKERVRPVYAHFPQFDDGLCTGCRRCVDFCRFGALVFVKERPLLFPELCHDCGGCALVCPRGAVRDGRRKLGRVLEGEHGGVRVVTGELNEGEASGVRVIEEALKSAVGSAKKENLPLFIDCPPGSACPVMQSLSAADYCILVAEPTAFGFHNFLMVHALAKAMGKPCGVVVNRQEAPYAPLEKFCAERKLPVLTTIPYRPELAQLCADGKPAVEENERAAKGFAELLQTLREAAT